jgi:predicted permease
VLGERVVGHVLALLREGVTVGDVESELAGLSEGLEDVPADFAPAVSPPYSFLGNVYVQGLWLVFGGVVVLLFVAVANTASLLLNRTASRAGELGVRIAVGGSPWGLARLFLIESIALTGLGLALSVWVARVGGVALAALVPARLAVLQGASGDVRVLAYAALLATGIAIVCGLVPLTQMRSVDVRRLLGRAEVGRSGGGRSGRVRELLVAFQVALAVLIVTGSALTLRSFRQLTAVDTGMAIDKLAEFAIKLPAGRYPTPEARSAFWERVLEVAAAVPGVAGVTSSDVALLRYGLYAGTPQLEGEPREPERGALSYGAGVRRGFFSVTGIPLLEGHDFEPGEEGDVMIVNYSFARSHGESVVGRRLTFDGSKFYRIIGVAGDVAAGGVADYNIREVGATSARAVHRIQFYTPSRAIERDYGRFIVRTSGEPSVVLGLLRARVSELDPELPFREATTGPETVRNQTARHRFVAQLLAVFGSLTLLLAVTGVYGMVALDLTRRTRELGIRVALGAGVNRIARDVASAGLRPVVFGLVAGAIATLFAVRYIEGVLYNISPTDPLSIVAAIVLLLCAAGAACAVVARRAIRIDPLEALRLE